MSKRIAKLPLRFAVQNEAYSGLITGGQLRAARAFLKLSQKELSALSKVSNLTIVRMEATEGAVTRRAKLLASIVAILSRRGIRFFSSGRFGEGVLLEHRRRRRH